MYSICHVILFYPYGMRKKQPDVLAAYEISIYLFFGGTFIHDILL